MRVNLEGPLDAKILICGEAPGEEEDKQGRPFVGYAGHILDNLLGQAGIARYQCLVTNVAKERPPANRISYYSKLCDTIEEAASARKELERIHWADR